MSENKANFLLSLLVGSIGLLGFLLPASVNAATVTVVNLDSQGEGFNDTTPVSPAGGNSGTTIGQQRTIAFQHAANIWGSHLQSAVPIRVGGQFDPLPCTASSGTLGSAGPKSANRDFVGAPVAGTWYPIALANAIAGVDFLPNDNHISATFSSTIGSTGCLESSGWYYGLDASPPQGKIDFVSVLLHELGHGLGFLTYVDRQTGAKALGFDDAYMRHLERHGSTPPSFPNMTDAQRLAASIDTGNLHWTGANVRAASSTLSIGTVGDHVRMYAPNPVVPGSSVSHWDTVLSPNQMMEPSYTVPIHTPSLELQLFKDIGWGVNTLAPGTYALNVTVAGSGTVTSNPSGINCGGDCSENYANGSNVTLTATPNSGYIFSNWSGACSGSSSSCVVNMNAAKSVTATFASTQQATLSIAKVGTGAGTVYRTNGAINCGTTCSESVAPGAIATINASPASGSTFAGWSGGACAGTGSCSFSVNADATVNAQFNLIAGGKTLTPLLLSNLSGVSGSSQYYSLALPAGARNLVIQISGGNGDADLYVKYGQQPNSTNYDCRPYLSGNNEICSFQTPNAGIYYISITGFQLFSGLTLSASYQVFGFDPSIIINLLIN